MQEWTGYGLLPSWLEMEVKLTEPRVLVKHIYKETPRTSQRLQNIIETTASSLSHIHKHTKISATLLPDTAIHV